MAAPMSLRMLLLHKKILSHGYKTRNKGLTWCACVYQVRIAKYSSRWHPDQPREGSKPEHWSNVAYNVSKTNIEDDEHSEELSGRKKKRNKLSWKDIEIDKRAWPVRDEKSNLKDDTCSEGQENEETFGYQARGEEGREVWSDDKRNAYWAEKRKMLGKIQQARVEKEEESSVESFTAEERRDFIARAMALFPVDNKHPNQPENAKVLKVAIIGAPNVGKSTLINRLMVSKMFPVSKRAHTTRKTTNAILTHGDTQIILQDTPGVVDVHSKKRHHLDRHIVLDPEKSLREADLVAVIVDASCKWTKNEINKNVLKILHMHRDKPSILILNKVDAVVNKTNLLEVTRNLTLGKIENQATSAMPMIGSKKKSKQEEEEILKARVIEKHIQRKKHEALQKLKESDTDECNLSLEEKLLLDHVDSTMDVYRTDVPVDSVVTETSLDVTESWSSETSTCDSLSPLDVTDDKVIQKMLREEMDSYIKRVNDLDPILQEVRGWPFFSDVFMISAKMDDGVNVLRKYFLLNAKPGDWVFNSEILSDENPQEMARMIVWEKILDIVPGDTPFRIFPEVVTWYRNDEDTLVIEMILESSNSYLMKNLMGVNFRSIMSIEREAQQELQNLFHSEVFLKVKVIRKLTRQQIKNQNLRNLHRKRQIQKADKWKRR